MKLHLCNVVKLPRLSMMLCRSHWSGKMLIGSCWQWPMTSTTMSSVSFVRKLHHIST